MPWGGESGFSEATVIRQPAGGTSVRITDGKDDLPLGLLHGVYRHEDDRCRRWEWAHRESDNDGVPV